MQILHNCSIIQVYSLSIETVALVFKTEPYLWFCLISHADCLCWSVIKLIFFVIVCIVGQEWYFSSLRLFTWWEAFSVFSEPKVSSVIKWLKLENWKSLRQLKCWIRIPRDGTWLFKSKQTLFDLKTKRASQIMFHICEN